MEISRSDIELDLRLGAHLKQARLRQGWTLDRLAAQAGVSRAMISRIERGESSPTASLLVRLCGGLGIALSSLFKEERRAGPLIRRDEQPLWCDPGSGYVRRSVSPPGAGSRVDLVEIVIPDSGRVIFDASHPSRRIDQQVWMIDGAIEITVQDTAYRLETGDCLHMERDAPVVFFNPGPGPCRYAVIQGPAESMIPERS